jgi:hypothetical protein
VFNKDKADSICQLIEEGKSLRAACEEVGVKAPTALLWVSTHPHFAEQYANSRAVGYKLLADEILSIADEKDVEVKYDGDDVRLDLSPTAIARNRLRVDTRKWMLSKMLPKVYGDKLELSGNKDAPLEVVTRIELVALNDNTANKTA